VADEAIDISEADEADMVAASKANVTNKADEAKNNKADEAFAPEAIDATATDEANVANEANYIKADVANKLNKADKAEANETNKAKVDEVNKFIVDNAVNEIVAVDEAILDDAANKAIKVGRATNKANELPLDGGNVIIYFIVIYFSFGLLILYSLTKYSAIFAEVKGYFRITAPNNQLGPMSSFFLKSNNQLECLESGWSKSCSLRN
jgi:hypothetical protein